MGIEPTTSCATNRRSNQLSYFRQNETNQRFFSSLAGGAGFASYKPNSLLFSSNRLTEVIIANFVAEYKPSRPSQSVTMIDNMKKRAFPKNFLWGASTAAHQVEGGLHNQWSEWERANAERLAATFTKRLRWLPNLKDVEAAGTDPANYISGSGVEHYRCYKEDFGILQQLHMNAFRFGIEWARLEPREGEWDAAAIEHYRGYIAELKKRGIEPIPTLWHWTLPTWFTDKGGFARRNNVRYFERFAAKVAEELDEGLRYVITLNEPNVYVSFSYIMGEWPPQGKNPWRALRVYCNLVRAHRRAAGAFRRVRPEVQIGVAMNMGNALPGRPGDIIATVVVRLYEYLAHWWFVDRIRRQQDFIGINYYMTDYFRGFRHTYPPKPKSDMGWSMEPDKLERVLCRAWRRYRTPLVITENGLADAGDKHRKWWIEETLAAMRRAMAAGVDLRGYLHWSLLDNFEWSMGWWPKFGLTAVDRRTMQRTVRPSAKWFGEQIARISQAGR